MIQSSVCKKSLWRYAYYPCGGDGQFVERLRYIRLHVFLTNRPQGIDSLLYPSARKRGLFHDPNLKVKFSTSGGGGGSVYAWVFPQIAARVMAIVGNCVIALVWSISQEASRAPR